MKESNLFQIDSSELIFNDIILNNNKIKTLPELIISEIVKTESSLTKDEIMKQIAMHHDKLRKPDGSRYGKNLTKVLSSTLHSTNLFKRTPDNKYTLNKDEVLQYLQRNKDKERERIDLNKGSNDNNEANNKPANMNTSMLHRKRIRKTLLPSNAKFIHAYQILDDLLSQYSRDRTISKKINNPFAKCNDSKEFILKTRDSERLLGMISCFKMFKPLLKKIFTVKKQLSKKNIIEMNEKISHLQQGIDFIHEMLDVNYNSNI